MAITAHSDLFIATVADNMRQYTKREVNQATNARELMARLAHASSQATIGMLDTGRACIISGNDRYARHRSRELYAVLRGDM